MARTLQTINTQKHIKPYNCVDTVFLNLESCFASAFQGLICCFRIERRKSEYGPFQGNLNWFDKHNFSV